MYALLKVVLGAGTLVVITVNLLLVRRVFEPLERLTALMRRVDLRVPGRRLAVDRADRVGVARGAVDGDEKRLA